MKIKCVSGFAAITKDPAASASLYQDALSLPLEKMDDYRFMDKFPGANHFGVWPSPWLPNPVLGRRNGRTFPGADSHH